MENPIKMDDLGVPPFKETPIWFFVFVSFFCGGSILCPIVRQKDNGKRSILFLSRLSLCFIYIFFSNFTKPTKEKALPTSTPKLTTSTSANFLRNKKKLPVWTLWMRNITKSAGLWLAGHLNPSCSKWLKSPQRGP